MKSLPIILLFWHFPSSVNAIGISTIICRDNTLDWIGFRKRSSLFFETVYEMRPKRNLWVELKEGNYCNSMVKGKNSFSCQTDINGVDVLSLVDFERLVYIKIVNKDKEFAYKCIGLD